MTQNTDYNRRIVLASRPEGAPTTENFRLEKTNIPTPAEGELLLQTHYLSLDPYMRGRMSDGPSYAPPVQIGEVMGGATVSRVAASRHPDYQEGDWLLAAGGWQDYALSDGSGLSSLGQNPQQPSYALGILGMPGFTAYVGLLEIGQPAEGDTLVVAAATGPVGATVGQIAKMKGCRVIGVAGSNEKCSYAVETLGFDSCLNHRAEDFSEQLERSCPDGIDIYYESVGGTVFSAVLPLLTEGARVPVCGLVAHYNATRLPDGPDRLPLLMRNILVKRLKLQGFIIFDHYAKSFPTFYRDMTGWLEAGSIRYREDRIAGLEKAPEAFIGLLEGRNFGKLVIEVRDNS